MCNIKFERFEQNKTNIPWPCNGSVACKLDDFQQSLKMSELLKEAQLLTKESCEETKDLDLKTVSGEAALKDKVVGLFFSALWCPPCQHFVPLLNSMYDELSQREEIDFEVVFISMDKNKEDMIKYYSEKHGQWLAMNFDDPIKE